MHSNRQDTNDVSISLENHILLSEIEVKVFQKKKKSG